jgi:hypothetical protein
VDDLLLPCPLFELWAGPGQNSEFLMWEKEPVAELTDATQIRILAFSDTAISSGTQVLAYMQGRSFIVENG